MAVLRALLRQRGYVSLALATLTLAIGANLVVFTIVNALWLRPRPVTDPDRVVWVTGDAGSQGSSENFQFGPLGLERLRESGAFEGVAGQTSTSGEGVALRPLIALEPVGHTVETIPVTPEYFSVLGLSIAGRDFTKDDDRASAPAVAIISYRLWQDVFRGRMDIVNSTVKATPIDITIIGVAPDGFSGARLGEQADLWIPRNLVPRVSSLGRTNDGSVVGEFPGALLAFARLRPNVTPSNAERLIADYQASTGRGSMFRLVVIPLSQLFGSPEHRTIVVRERTVLQVIAGTAAFVLAGGCATLMALVLVHYERRRHELAVRLALGSSRIRLTGHLAIELGMLGAAGCVCALLAAHWTLAALPAFSLPGGIDLGRIDLRLDARVVAAGIGISVLTLLAAAVLPVERFTRASLVTDLIASSSTSTAASVRLRRAMLTMHVAATVVVLIAAGLFVRTVAYGFARGAGFDVDETVFVAVSVGSPYDLTAMLGNRGPRSRQEGDAAQAELAVRRRARSQRVLDSLSSTAGIDVLSLGGSPLGPEASRWIGQPRTVLIDAAEKVMHFEQAWVGPAYSRALGLRLLAGRELTDADAAQGLNPANVVITLSFAEALWPGQSPLGRRFQLDRIGTPYEVVGVVADFAYGSISLDMSRVILRASSLEGSAANDLRLAIRTHGPDQLVSLLRKQLAAVLPDSPRIEVLTGRDVVARDLGRERMGAWFFSGFGLVALVLGVAGVFGLVAYLAESRRREMGVRMALGAEPSDLIRLSVVAGLQPVALGAIVGVLGAAWLARFVESQLMGVGRLDPFTYISAGLLMLLVALTAGYTAALRIRRISPLEALRSE